VLGDLAVRDPAEPPEDLKSLLRDCFRALRLRSALQRIWQMLPG